MSIPGYDAWKLMSPDDERPQDDDEECPFCGAVTGQECLLESDEGEDPPCVTRADRFAKRVIDKLDEEPF